MPIVAVTWEASDLSRFTPASAPLLAAPVKTGQSADIGQPTSSAQVSSAGGTSGGTSRRTNGLISTGVRAGIGVGIGLFVLIVAGIASLFLRRRRRKRALMAHMEDQQPYVHAKSEPYEFRSHGSSTGELDDSQSPRTPAELGNREVQEVHAIDQPYEVSAAPPVPYASKPTASSRDRSELAGGFEGYEVSGTLRGPAELHP
jgi:hypothetical protein